jgi:DNA sulfur modification protein DndD
MIITRLVVHNFGVYLGRFELDLRPPSRNRPIVLFSALNGGGKTTLLDALQLVLYGKLAQCSNRRDLTYEDYLRRAIHRGVPPSEGALLEIEFVHVSEGHEQTFRVVRSWSARERSVRERLDVYRRDGTLGPMTLDPVLAESWAEHIEELIPVRLSKFFFFDGEKIESLADLERSTEILSTAVQSLLGLDLVDQLSTDLVVLERRKNAQRKTAEERQAILDAQREVDTLKEERERLVDERGSAQNVLDRAQMLARTADEEFRRGGGGIFERRREYEIKRDSVAAQIRVVEDELLELASGIAPLLLLGDLLDTVEREAAVERNAGVAAELTQALAQRDQRIVEVVRDAGVTGKALQRLLEFLDEDLRTRAVRSVDGHFIGLSPDGYTELVGVGRSHRDEIARRVRRLLDLFDEHQREAVDVDRLLASAPDSDAIARLATTRADAQGQVDLRQRELAVIDADLERVKRDYDAKWALLARLMERAVEEQHRQEELTRLVLHSEGVRTVLVRFRDAVLRRHVGNIETLVLAGLQHLLRKQSLVAGLRIDPATFALSLLDAAGSELPPERLSAGERQILAVSIIWGIARASGRVLPVAVDTPLGRLDSTHRKLLVDRYFPHASHQVLLFSTDEEIKGEYYERLKPAVGLAYHLTYDDRQRASKIEEGYPW